MRDEWMLNLNPSLAACCNKSQTCEPRCWGEGKWFIQVPVTWKDGTPVAKPILTALAKPANYIWLKASGSWVEGSSRGFFCRHTVWFGWSSCSWYKFCSPVVGQCVSSGWVCKSGGEWKQEQCVTPRNLS